MSKRPNILIVLLDTVRAKELGLGRDDGTLVPGLRQLGRDGLVWGHAISPSTWTIPAHASLFSGLLPSEHGVVGGARIRTGGWGDVIGGLQDRWLPSLLTRAGYETFGISTNPSVSRETGLDAGFERWSRVRTISKGRSWVQRLPSRSAARRVARTLRFMGRAHWVAFRPGDHGSSVALSMLRAEIDRSNQPFFGFVNLMEAHSPYWTPESANLPLAQRVEGLTLLAPGAARRFNRFNDGSRALSVRWLKMLRAFYTASLRHLDGVVEQIVGILQTRGIAEDTLLVVLSDHGEHLGEYRILGHTLSLHEELLHVPALVWGPIEPGLVKEPTSTMEIRRLVLDRAGVTPKDEPPMAAGEFEGMRMTRPAFLGRRPLVDTEGTALYEGSWKLWAESDGTERFFSIVDGLVTEGDPPPADIAARLRDRRDSWLSRVERRSRAPSPHGAQEATGGHVSGGVPSEGPSETELREVEDHLADLGYIE